MKFFKSNVFIIILSIFFSLVLVETFFYIKNKNIKNYLNLFSPLKRFMLFEEGEVFKNVDNFFKYTSNKNILNKTFYKIEKNWLEEYSYKITTNNFGLVQSNDIFNDRSSILLLGDSFVEGQGATPWVNNFGGEYKKYQIINGGITGTGPQQFELIEKHISRNFKINKVLFFYIGDDLRRNIFNISKDSLDCLNDYTSCGGSENFYGFPLSSEDPKKFLNFLHNYRVNLKKNTPFIKKIKKNLKTKFSNLYIIKMPLNYIRHKFYITKNEYMQRNLNSIKNLHEKYKNNIFFIQLTNKNEILYGKEYDTFYAEKYIKKISKNHFLCNFDENINFFHKIDMHPNEDGYKDLYQCVLKILDKNLQ
jgi:hypothetical protein